MIYLKTYEGLFDYFKNKKKEVTSEEIKEFSVPFTEEELSFCKEYLEDDKNKMPFSKLFKPKAIKYTDPKPFEIFEFGIPCILVGGAHKQHESTIKYIHICFGKASFMNSPDEYEIYKYVEKYGFSTNTLFFVESYNGIKKFASLKTACEEIRKNLFLSRLCWSFGYRQTYRDENQPKRYEEIKNLLSEYSVLRNEKVDRYRAEDMAEEIGEDPEDVINRLKLMNIDVIE